MTKRRRFHRFPFDAKAVLHVGSRGSGLRGSVPCELLDLSLNGVMVRVPESLEEDRLQERNLVGLAVRGAIRGDEVTMTMHITPAHVAGSNVGLRFTRVDIDSFDALKTLIEDNLGNPDLLDRELTQLDYWPGEVAEEN